MIWVVLAIGIISLVAACFYMRTRDYGIATASFELSALSFAIFALML